MHSSSKLPVSRRALSLARGAGSLLLLAPVLGAIGGGCIASSADVAAEDPQATTDALLASESIARAEKWVKVGLHYCQAPNHERDYDAACATYCNRHDDAQWDPYRSDCSGLVSWAWQLPAPGRVTGELAPFQSDITHTISASSLRAGDAVNNSEHVMLFKAWVHHGTRATFIEEPGCSSATPYAHELTSNVSIHGDTIDVDWNGMTFTAIRYNGIKSAPPAPTEKAPAKPTAKCGILHAGEGLLRGESMPSCDGRFKLSMQHDGNLVLYEGKKALWATATNATDVFDVVMQHDGNLVVYSAHSAPLWASHTNGHQGAHLSVQDDGNLVVYKNGKPDWASNTCCH